jgi:hypothetical protein
VYANVTAGALARRCLFVEALERCVREFERRPASRPRLWLGVRPQTILNHDQTVDVYLAAGSTDPQYRFQCAQEVFHAVCGPAMIHWTHELLSIHFALRHLEASGREGESAAQVENLKNAATAISTPELLGWRRWPRYPDADIYGRVFVLGEQLIAAIGWASGQRRGQASG